jgi:D-galacturonate reductase
MNVLMVGTGEYTTGYVGGVASDSDKGAGVVALTMFDLRSKGLVNRIGMVGVNGKKFPGIRKHLQRMVGDPYGLDTQCDTYPGDDVVDPLAYRTAISTFKRGDCAIIFTPDDTHHDIALACIRQGLHVLVTKPIVKTLEEHLSLSAAATEENVLVGVEVHKRLDPFYADAKDRAQSLGNLNYMVSYMSQPKHQLQTFAAWAGKSSDISYYLNSHHVDFTEWAFHNRARPIRVTAAASTGVAASQGINTEDSITLTVTWENTDSSLGTAVYTSSWVAPKSDVHSNQRFFMMLSAGEINVDQAHRGYSVSTDEKGYASANPLFMKYTPSNGKFVGQSSYGYKSFSNFIEACVSINSGANKVADYDDGHFPSVHTTFLGTAILEAGRISLDNDCRPVDVKYGEGDYNKPTGVEVRQFK